MREHQLSCREGSSLGTPDNRRGQGIQQYLHVVGHNNPEKVENLRQMFPDVPTAEVERILQDVNGSMDEAASVIILRNSSVSF